MKRRVSAAAGAAMLAVRTILAQQPPAPVTRAAPPVITEDFAATMARMKAAKPGLMTRQLELLDLRYDLRDLPVDGDRMSGGKAVQGGVRVKLAAGVTWEGLADLTPADTRDRDLFPAGFYPLPHPRPLTLNPGTVLLA